MQELTIKKKLINYYYFIIINSLFAIFIGCCYSFSVYTSCALFTFIKYYIISIIFTIASHISIIAVSTFLIGFIYLPTILLKGYSRIIILSIIASISMLFLFYDVYIFHVYGLHLTNVIGFNNNLLFLKYNPFELINFSCLLQVSSLFFVLFITQFFLIKWIDRSEFLIKSNLYKIYTIFIIILFCMSSVVYLTGSELRKEYITSFVSYLPWFDKNRSNPWQHVNGYSINFKDLYNNNLNNINYPLQPLKTKTVIKPVNILIIGIDAWRADCFNARNSPNLWQLAQKGTIYKNHLSGSNSTRHGLFSLFYGMPATHWYSFLQQEQSPVFIDRLQQLNYQMGVFISKDLQRDKLDKTTFSKVKNLPLESQGSTPSAKDANCTNEWLTWYKNLDKTKPFFSFIFYFSAHEHDFPEEYSKKYMPTKGKIRYINLFEAQGYSGFKNSYNIAVRYVDSLVHKIICELEKTNILDNTIVIITSDHGRELDDNLQLVYGHGTNLTNCQLHVPLAIIGPKFNNQQSYQVNKLTTHYDLIPTLMQNFLGVANDPSDYSTGIDLLSTIPKRTWHLATNFKIEVIPFTSVGIITENFIEQHFVSGKTQILDKTDKKLSVGKFSHNYFSEALEIMTRFLKK